MPVAVSGITAVQAGLGNGSLVREALEHHRPELRRGAVSLHKQLLGEQGSGRNRTAVDGFAGRCMTTLPPNQ